MDSQNSDMPAHSDQTINQNHLMESNDTDDIDSWNPMKEDYTNKAFNNYKEPTTTELRKYMPQQGGAVQKENLMPNCRSSDGDVRLFVSGIPRDLTQEGVRGLFNQAGNVVYCKVIPQRNTSRKDAFGFVGFNSFREAEKAIRLFDGFALGKNIRLKVSLAKRKLQDMHSDASSMPVVLNEVNGNEEGLDWDAQANDINSEETDSTAIESNSVAMSDNSVAKDDGEMLKQTNLSKDKLSHNSQSNIDVTKSPKPAFVYSEPVSTFSAVSNNSKENDVANKQTLSVQKSSSKPEVPEAPCSVCGKNGRRRCSSCKVQYCSKDCQRKAWPEHKKVCTWKSPHEIERKTLKTDEPYVIDEDEMEISGPLGFMQHFGVHVRPDVMSALQPNAFEQNNREYLEFDSEYPQWPINGLRNHLERAQITEIEESNEMSEMVNNTSSPLIEEINCASINTSQPLIPKILSDNLQPANHSSTTLESELISGKEEPIESITQQPIVTEISPNSNLSSNPVSADNNKLVIEEIIRFNGTDHLESKMTLIELPKEEPEPATITEFFSNDTVQAYRAPLITEITPNTSQNINDKNHIKLASSYHRYRFADIPSENMFFDNQYDIVVTFVSSPNLFWAQLFARDTLERQNFLYETLTDAYTNSVYENYIPMVGDVCVAQYTKDDNWYRSKVNLINNNGYINVTHIDFGSSEDVDLSRIRRITSDLASIPKQAIKCSLYFTDVLPKEWTPQLIEAFSSEVLDVKCRVECMEVKDSVCFLEVYAKSGGKVNDILLDMKRKSLEKPTSTQAVLQAPPPSADPLVKQSMLPEGPDDQSADSVMATLNQESQLAPPMTMPSVLPGQPSEQNPTRNTNTPDQICLSVSPDTWTMPVESPDKDHLTSEPPLSSATDELAQTSVRECNLASHSSPAAQPEQHCPTSPAQSVLPGQTTSSDLISADTTSSLVNGDVPSDTISNSSSEVDFKAPLSPSSPKQGRHGVKEKFEAVVSSVVSPIEFQVTLTDPQHLEKLGNLSSKLQEYCNAKTFDPSTVYKFNEICAVRTIQNTDWYRARVTFLRQKDNYCVQLMDIDMRDTVSTDNMRPVPDWVKDLPPTTILCSLGGIVKRPGMTNFGKEASDKFSSLVLNKKFTCQEISRKKNVWIIELLDELSQPSVCRELVNCGFADAFVKKSPVKMEHTEVNPLLNSCRMAISSASLPNPGQVFQANITEFKSPGHFFIHLRDDESQQKLDGIYRDMNRYYAEFTSPSDWQAREGQHCAAFFKGSWLRAFVKSINEDNVVTVFCVDFGNVEIVSNSALRPLAPEFSARPHCALHCSLANIVPSQGSTDWSKEAVEFARMKMPLSSTMNVSLVFKGQTILFIDVFLPNTERLSQLLVSKWLASYGRMKGFPGKEERFGKRQERRVPYQQKSPRGGSRETPLNPKEMAIISAKLPPGKEAIKILVTNITSPSCFAVQIADYEMVSKVAALHTDLNSHYNNSTYPPFQPTLNQICAAQFTGNNSWYRAWVEKVVDDKVHVYYTDYGNSEALDVTRLRPLEAQFKSLPYAALTCSLGSITCQSSKWSEEAIKIFSNKVPLFEAIEAKAVFKKLDCLFLEIPDPHDPTTTINKTFVANNLAVWMYDKKPRHEITAGSPSGAMPTDLRGKKPKINENLLNDSRGSSVKNTESHSGNTRRPIENKVMSVENPLRPMETPTNPTENASSAVETPGHVCNGDPESATRNLESAIESPVKYAIDSIPLVEVIHEVFHNGMVCDINPQGIVSIQILRKDIEELVSLGANINVHCSQIDKVPYSPAAGELCFACFTEDKEWYRAVVDHVLPQSQFKVTFVDYGNQDTVSSQAIRVMNEQFLGLPRQAYTVPLKGIASTNYSPLSDGAINALKEQLLEKRSFVRVDKDGAEFFNVGPDNQPGKSVNAVFMEILYPPFPSELDTQFEGFVTEVQGTCEIWLQLKESSDVIKTLTDDVNFYCNNTSQMTLPPSEGDLVFVKHSFYQSWYRGRVDGWNPPVASVRFVDYGYSEEVRLDNLRPPRPDLLRLPPQAAKCYLVRVVQRNPGADDFIKQILNREFNVRIIEKKGEVLGVELEDYDVANGPLNINDYLIGFGYGA